jgi:hypothetical protein
MTSHDVESIGAATAAAERALARALTVERFGLGPTEAESDTTAVNALDRGSPGAPPAGRGRLRYRGWTLASRRRR